MNPYQRQKQGQQFEGWAFTFCKAAFLVLIFQRYALLALSGLATLFYVLASLRGVREWRCWAKPPWVTLFWGAIFVWQLWGVLHTPSRPLLPAAALGQARRQGELGLPGEVHRPGQL